MATNTVGRAYRELELEGLVAPRGRHGTLVLAAGAAPEPEVIAGAASSFALEAAHRGLDLDQALDAVRAAFHHLQERGA